MWSTEVILTTPQTVFQLPLIPFWLALKQSGSRKCHMYWKTLISRCFWQKTYEKAEKIYVGKGYRAVLQPFVSDCLILNIGFIFLFVLSPSIANEIWVILQDSVMQCSPPWNTLTLLWCLQIEVQMTDMASQTIFSLTPTCYSQSHLLLPIPHSFGGHNTTTPDCFQGLKTPVIHAFWLCIFRALWLWHLAHHPPQPLSHHLISYVYLSKLRSRISYLPLIMDAYDPWQNWPLLPLLPSLFGVYYNCSIWSNSLCSC